MKHQKHILISYHVINDLHSARNKVAPGVGFEPTRPKWVTDSQLILFSPGLRYTRLPLAPYW